MTISLSDAGKRFNRDWIFRHFNYQFTAGKSYAITGPNGSGKSTLLQAIGGALSLSEGKLRYEIIASNIQKAESAENFYQYISIAAPYLELIEEMTAIEFLEFHQQFKPLLQGFSTKQVIDAVGLASASNKQIRYFSSGMKQRVKLAQAFFSNTPVILLDEPCTNLDGVGIELYRRLVAEYGSNRILIVSSNDKVEYDFCEDVLSIQTWKL